MIIIIADEYTIERGFSDIEAGKTSLSVRRDTLPAERAGLFDGRRDAGETAIAEQHIFLSAAEAGEREEEIK